MAPTTAHINNNMATDYWLLSQVRTGTTNTTNTHGREEGGGEKEGEEEVTKEEEEEECFEEGKSEE